MKIDKQTYKNTCALARAAGMVPLTNPTAEQITILSGIASDCEAAYSPLPEDARLAEWYLFRQSEQTGEQRASDGVCSINDSTIAVIGLSIEMLALSDAEATYPKIVALHELAHLSEAEHNERFSRRMMELECRLFSAGDIDHADERPMRHDSIPYDPFSAAVLVRHDSAPVTSVTARNRLTGESEAEAAYMRMLARHGISPKPERTPAQARAEMIERHRWGGTK